MDTLRYPKLDETVYSHTCENGLTVKIVPRPGFTRKMAYFVTDFGAVHTEFELEGQTYQVPAGIAHFLEHKMFDLPGRDVSAEFAALGANVNAFTGYDMTAYYFSCSENFAENLALLLEFVSTPYFTEESVQKEMGIIDQEIGMNEDTPDSCVFEDLMRCMYRTHPIRVPILGSRESLREITPELLYVCHRAFYTPANMILCVVGDVDAEEVVALADKILGNEPKSAGKKQNAWQENMQVEKSHFRATMEVAMPTFQMALKAEPASLGEAAIYEEIVGDLAAEALFGESSDLYLRLYEQGLIDSSFGGGYESVDGCAMLTCGGDSDNAYAVRDAILEEARKLAKEGIPKEDFLRMKRSAIGRRIRDLDSFDSTCFRICAYHFDEFDYFRFPAVYAAVRQDEVLEFLRRVVTKERCALSVIDPKEET